MAFLPQPTLPTTPHRTSQIRVSIRATADGVISISRRRRVYEFLSAASGTAPPTSTTSTPTVTPTAATPSSNGVSTDSTDPAEARDRLTTCMKTREDVIKADSAEKAALWEAELEALRTPPVQIQHHLPELVEDQQVEPQPVESYYASRSTATGTLVADDKTLQSSHSPAAAATFAYVVSPIPVNEAALAAAKSSAAAVPQERLSPVAAATVAYVAPAGATGPTQAAPAPAVATPVAEPAPAAATPVSEPAPAAASPISGPAPAAASRVSEPAPAAASPVSEETEPIAEPVSSVPELYTPPSEKEPADLTFLERIQEIVEDVGEKVEDVVEDVRDAVEDVVEDVIEAFTPEEAPPAEKEIIPEAEPEPVVVEKEEPEPVVAEKEEPLEPVVAEKEVPLEPVVAEKEVPLEPVVVEEEEPEPVVAEKEEPEPVVVQEEEPEPVVVQEEEPEPVVVQEEEPEPVVAEKEEGEDRSIGKVILDAIVEGVPTPAPEPEKPAVDKSDLIELIDSGKVKNLTVTKLRRLLSQNGLKTSGRKAELIARLTSFAKAK